MSDGPAVSVVVEGFNETLDIGSLDETIDALRNQTFPPAQTEVILVGSPAQIEVWERRYPELPFHSVQFVPAAGSHYYELKNRGARLANAPIVALTDSDVTPDREWLRVLVEGIRSGNAAVAGVSMFRGARGRRIWKPLLDVAASISWGFIPASAVRGEAGAFLVHNLGFRADLFQSGFRNDLGRTCAGSFLFSDWQRVGIKVRFQAEQRAAHAFHFRWWVTSLHIRFGYELYRLRRIHSGHKNRWVRYLGPVEPLATFAWHVCMDVPQWWRVGRILGYSASVRLAYLPLVVPLSLVARGSEVAGMYFTIFAPEAARRFAEQN